MNKTLQRPRPSSWGNCYTPALRCSWWYETLPPARSSVRRCSRNPEYIQMSDKTHPWWQPFPSALASAHWAERETIWCSKTQRTEIWLFSRARWRFAHFGFGVEDEAFVQSVSDTFDQLFPDPVLQKLLRIHLKQTCFHAFRALMV